MNLLVANCLNIAFANPPTGFVTFMHKHIPDLLSENELPNDILIRFVDQIEGADDELLIADFARQWRDQFFYIDKYGNKACIPLEKLITAEPFEIIAENSVLPALFFDHIIRLIIRHRLLQQNISFVHASGIAINGRGIIFPAWGGTGKTNMVIQFLRDGATYLGDDLVLASADGQLHSFPESIAMFDYNFKTFPEYKTLLGTHKRSLFLLKQAMERLDNLIGRLLRQESLLRATITRLATLSKSFTTSSMGHTKLAPESQVLSPVPLETVVFLTKANITAPELITESPTALAMRMAGCLDFEHTYQMRYINAFTFGLPEKPVPILRDTYEKERAILETAFNRVPIFNLRIPREMDSKALYTFTRKALNL